MKHFIIVKFKDNVEVHNLVEPIKKLFKESLNINGIDRVEFYTSNVNMHNRYDLMIEMVLSREALEAFDNSEIHKKWKINYGEYIESKAIFDCD